VKASLTSFVAPVLSTVGIGKSGTVFTVLQSLSLNSGLTEFPYASVVRLSEYARALASILSPGLKPLEFSYRASPFVATIQSVSTPLTLNLTCE